MLSRKSGTDKMDLSKTVDKASVSEDEYDDIEFENTGITFSEAPKDSASVAQAELEILKAILCREAYLTRLTKAVQTLSRKMKPEVADILDFIRSTSLNVIESIVTWRELKNDHDATYRWNGVNYLLKMPSDLDFLNNYPAIQRWSGFKIPRNPFFVPFAMESGMSKFADAVLDPQHIDVDIGSSNEGFVIGGISQHKLKTNYTPVHDAPFSIPPGKGLPDVKSNMYFKESASPYSVVQTPAPLGLNAVNNNKSGKKPTQSRSTGMLPTLTQASHVIAQAPKARVQNQDSFVLNSDMLKVRQCELVLLKEEETYGKFTRDSNGNVMSVDKLSSVAQSRSYMSRSMKVDKSSDGMFEDTQKIQPSNSYSELFNSTAAALPSPTHVDTSLNVQAMGLFDSQAEDMMIPRAQKPTLIKAEKVSKSLTVAQINKKKRKRTLGDRLNEIAELKDKITKERISLESSMREKNRLAVGGPSIVQPQVIKSQVSNVNTPIGMSSNLTEQDNDAMPSQLNKSPLPPIVTSCSAEAAVLDPNGGDELAHCSPRASASAGSAVQGARLLRAQQSGSAGRSSPLAASPVPPSSKAANFILQSKNRKAEALGVKSTKLNKSKLSKSISGILQSSSEAFDSSDTHDIDDGSFEQSFLEVLDRKDSTGHLEVGSPSTSTPAPSPFSKAAIAKRKNDLKKKSASSTPVEAAAPTPKKSKKALAYDVHSSRIQSVIRGFVARRFAKQHKQAVGRAVLLLQSHFRATLARVRVRGIVLFLWAATTIQRNVRGMAARMICTEKAYVAMTNRSAHMIQGCWRGVLGRRRVESKRCLDSAADEALQSVDPTYLFASDVKELAKRIQLAIKEPLTTTFPPDEVLHLIRMCTMILQTAKENVGLADYAVMNPPPSFEASGDTLSWVQACQMVMRSERFFRLIRSMAHGAAQRPPRLVQLPEPVMMLHAAQRLNPKWCLATFQLMGMGSKVCCQLFTWLRSIVEIADRQMEFTSFIANAFPDWLPQLLNIQATARKYEMDIIIDERCISTVEEEVVKVSDSMDPSYGNELEREIRRLREMVDENKRKIHALYEEEHDVCAAEASKDELALMEAAARLKVLEDDVNDAVMEYTRVLTVSEAPGGDDHASRQLPKLRAILTTCRIAANELMSQYKVMQAQCDTNFRRRNAFGKLNSVIRVRSLTAGEMKALFVIAHVKKVIMLKSTGAHRVSELCGEQLDLYQSLETTEKGCNKVSSTIFMEASQMREDFDRQVMQELIENDAMLQKTRSFFVPSEAELEEENIEADLRDKEAIVRAKQQGPDIDLPDPGIRPRPVVIAFARDVPGSAKLKMISEITRMMPGVFTQLYIPGNLGLDVPAMQTVLDAGKCIIMSVDHGLTKLARSDFLRSFETTVRALMPRPYVVLVVGDETNKRENTGREFYGVSSEDLGNSIDGSVKVALENISWTLNELLTPAITEQMRIIAPHELPPSSAYIVVLEAIYILHTDSRDIPNPDSHFTAVTWRSTKKLLTEPKCVVDSLRSRKRGSADLSFCTCMHQYTQHKFWPLWNERKDDPLLHLLAYYVEQWLFAEQTTLDNDGMPNARLYKSSMKGIHSIVPVIDGIDPADDNITKGGTYNGGWRAPAATVIRACLQDMRLIKNVLKIDKQTYNVCVYREGSTIYVDAYDPVNSQLYMESLQVTTVPGLLMPNAFGLADLGETYPSSKNKSVEVYQRLTKLLHFDKAIKHRDARKRLICRRSYTFLQHANFKLDGHRVLLSCFEAALGELYFSAYLPEASCKLTFRMEEPTRERFIKHSDRALERDVVSGGDALALLPFVVDRLRITPSHTMRMVQEASWAEHHQYEPRSGTGQDKTQGLALKLRSVSGVGRVLLKRLSRFGDVYHVVTIHSSAPTHTLIVYLYEPRTSHTLEVRITKFQRELIFGSLSDDVAAIYAPLIKRLKYNWKGVHRLTFDTRIFRSVRRLGKRRRRIVVDLHIIDEDALRVTLTDSFISEKFELIMDNFDVLKVLNFATQEDSIRKDFHLEVDKQSIKNILSNVTPHRIETTEDGPGGVPEEAELELKDVPFLVLLRDYDTLVAFADMLQIILMPKDPKSFYAGYYCDDPIKLVFDPVEKVVPKAGLTTDLRHFPQLFHRERENSTRGVVASRRQVPFVYMEEELNLVAQSKAAEKAAAMAQKALHAMDMFAAVEEPDDASTIVTKGVDIIENADVDGLTEIERKNLRRIEREKARKKEITIAPIVCADGVSIEHIPMIELSAHQREIVIQGDKLVFERGVKTNFKEGKSRWHGHVSVKVFEGLCSMGLDGVCRKYKFQVYEPECGRYFEGMVRSERHLREVLGIHAQALMDPSKDVDMVLFILKYRLDMTKNTTTWYGEPVDTDTADLYRVEFQSDHLFSMDKVTPINAGEEDDAEINKTKLIDLEHLRGRKLLRLAKRVSGLLMQLTVFEVPTPIKTIPEEGEGPPGQEVVKASTSATPGQTRLGGDTERTAAQKQLVQVLEAPTLRIVGYDPRSKRKATIMVPHEAVSEIAGGCYSPYLEVVRRRELAKIICESLLLFFPRGKPFELTVPWSGAASTEVTNALAGEKNSWRSGADRIVCRPGRIYRSGMRITNIELVISIYVTYSAPLPTTAKSTNIDNKPKEQVIVNFYSVAASEATEFSVSEKDQVDRLRRTFTSFDEGAIRAQAIRRFSRYFEASLVEDPQDINKKMLLVKLLPVNPDEPLMDFDPDVAIRKATGGSVEEMKPIGVPEVFSPIDTCGTLVHCTNRALVNPDEKKKALRHKEFIVSIYTRTELEPPERGLVYRMFEKASCQTLILHIGTSELVRLCNQSEQYDMLKNMVDARLECDDYQLDEIEQGFIGVTTDGAELEKANTILKQLLDLVIEDIAVRNDKDGFLTPYSLTSTSSA